MEGIEKITARIEQDVQREIDGVLAQARAQADDITARYEAQAAKESEDILARGRKSAGERVERLYSVAQLEGKKRVLAVKQEMVGRAFDDAGRAAQAYASNKLQVAISFSDSMMCLFAFSNVVPKKELLGDLMSGLYGGPADFSRVTVGLGVKTLLTERAFNKMAGFTDADDKLPDFFYTERSDSTGSVFDIDQKEIDVLFDF